MKEAPEQAFEVKTAGHKGLPAAEAGLPPVPSQTIVTSDAQSMAKDALEKSRASQEKLLKELKERLSEVYQAETTLEFEGRRQRLWENYQKDLDEAYEEIRRRFEVTSDEMGPLVHRLAWLAGFPDPDPRSRRPIRGTYLEKESAKEAAAIRPKIRSLSDSLKDQVEEILAEVAGNYRADLDALDEEAERAAAAALARAEKEAREEASRGSLALEKSAFDPEKTLPGAPGERVSRTAFPAIPPQAWKAKTRSLWPLKERLKSEALVFARARGWHLSDNASGVPDKTKEFLAWRKSMGLSRSPN